MALFFPSDEGAKIDIIQSIENYQISNIVEIDKVNIKEEIATYMATTSNSTIQ